MQVHQAPLVLLTRPRAASERFAAVLDGAKVVIAPLMEIAATGAEVSLDGVTGVILTSENAVPFLPAAALPAYCVGPRTAEAAAEAGFAAEIMGPDADGLVAGILARRPEGRWLHVHGAHVRGDVAGRLAAAGVEVGGVAAYAQRAVPPGEGFHAAMARGDVIIPLFSPRSAGLFARATPSLPAPARIIAISQATLEALPPEFYAQTACIKAPNGAEMRGAVLKALSTP